MTKEVIRSITVSVVSHGQGEFISRLLEDLVCCANVSTVILTQNIPEPEINIPESLRSRIHLIRNKQPKGFAENHNQAFRQCGTDLFAVINPDIRLNQDPFLLLSQVLAEPSAGLAAPVVISPMGTVEDSARYFPTIGQLFVKLLRLGDGRVVLGNQVPNKVDWTAGMFMLFRTEVYRDLGGFDEGFFLYYEDVDICVRMWKAGFTVLLHPKASVVHAAQRASRSRPRYLAWHLSSMVRYFCKHAWRLPR